MGDAHEMETTDVTDVLDREDAIETDVDGDEDVKENFEYVKKALGYRDGGKDDFKTFFAKKIKSNGEQKKLQSEFVNLRREVLEMRNEFRHSAQRVRDDERARIEEEISEAIDSGDRKRTDELYERLHQLKSTGARTNGDALRGDRRTAQVDADDMEIEKKLNDFCDENPWVDSSDEVSGWVNEEIRLQTKNGVSIDEALRRIKRGARREFPGLFEETQSEKRKPYAPPVGDGGRPAGNQKLTMRNIPPGERDAFQKSIDRMVREGKSKAEATTFAINWFAENFPGDLVR